MPTLRKKRDRSATKSRSRKSSEKAKHDAQKLEDKRTAYKVRIKLDQSLKVFPRKLRRLVTQLHVEEISDYLETLHKGEIPIKEDRYFIEIGTRKLFPIGGYGWQVRVDDIPTVGWANMELLKCSLSMLPPNPTFVEFLPDELEPQSSLSLDEVG
jgi:hypothetical protein